MARWQAFLARGDHCKRFGVPRTGEVRRGDEGDIDQRLGQRGATAFARDQRRLGQAETKPAVRLGHQQTGQAHIDQPLPNRRIAIGSGIERTQHFGAVRAGQVVAHTFG